MLIACNNIILQNSYRNFLEIFAFVYHLHIHLVRKGHTLVLSPTKWLGGLLVNEQGPREGKRANNHTVSLNHILKVIKQ